MKTNLGLEDGDYILMTWHRQENTESEERILSILNFLQKIEKKIVYPIHPRTKHVLKEHGLLEKLADMDNMILIDPVGYSDKVRPFLGKAVLIK